MHFHGEGPFWDAVNDRLLLVDMLAGAVVAVQPTGAPAATSSPAWPLRCGPGETAATCWPPRTGSSCSGPT